METLTVLSNEKIQITKKLKHLKKPEFEINVSIDIPEMLPDIRKRYTKAFNLDFLPKKKRMIGEFLKQYNDAIHYLDKKIDGRIQRQSDLKKRLSKNGVAKIKTKPALAQKLKKDIEKLEVDAAELMKVIDSYEPTLKKAVATLQSQIEAQAETSRDNTEKLLSNELKHKKSANRKKWVKVAIVTGIVLVGVAVAIATVATGGLVGVALGLAIAATAVTILGSGIEIAKEIKGLKNSLVKEADKVAQHLERFDKAVAAVAKQEGRNITMDYLGTKKPPKSVQTHWKSCLASMSKLEKHVKRMGELSFSVQIELREKERLLNSIEQNLEKAKSSYASAKKSVAQYQLPTEHEKANQKMIKDARALKLMLSRVQSKMEDVNGLKKAYLELKSDLNNNRKKIEDVSISQKKCVRALKFATSIFGAIDTLTSATASSYDMATAP